MGQQSYVWTQNMNSRKKKKRGKFIHVGKTCSSNADNVAHDGINDGINPMDRKAKNQQN